jgi:hypothetical protein
VDTNTAVTANLLQVAVDSRTVHGKRGVALLEWWITIQLLGLPVALTMNCGSQDVFRLVKPVKYQNRTDSCNTHTHTAFRLRRGRDSYTAGWPPCSCMPYGRPGSLHISLCHERAVGGVIV